MNNNLFVTVMEAEGDLLQPFEDNTENAPPTDAGMTDQSTQPTDTGSEPDGNGPPPLSEDDDMQQYSAEDQSLNDNPVDDTGGEAQEEDKTISEKANNILNQKLYQQLVSRNDEISEIADKIQIMIPLLPFDVVKENDKTLNQLNSALKNGQDYVIYSFIQKRYGENLLYFQKLDSLYTLLLNKLDENLKKIKN